MSTNLVNKYKQGYSFKVGKPSLNYQVRNRSGVREYSSGYFVNTMQHAIDRADELKGGNVLLEWLKTDYPLGDTIKLKDHVGLIGEKPFVRIKSEDALNKNMIENADGHAGTPTGEHGCVIKNLFLDGNKAQQTSGKGIDWVCTGGNKASFRSIHQTLILENIIMNDIKEKGIHADNTGATGKFKHWYRNIHIVNPDEEAIYWQVVSESFIDRLLANSLSSIGTVMLLYSTGNYFSNFFLGGGMRGFTFNQSHRNFARDIRCDYYSQEGVYISGDTEKCVITGLKLSRCCRQTNDTYSALKVLNTASKNAVCGIIADSTEDNKPKYIIEEVDSADYNAYGGALILQDYVTGAFTLGVNSKIEADAIIT